VRDYLRTNLDVDVCPVLPSIRVPTLILHRTALAGIDVRGARYLAEHIRVPASSSCRAGTSHRAVGDPEALLPSARLSLDELEYGRRAGGEA
jgi:hypothetical protein